MQDNGRERITPCASRPGVTVLVPLQVQSGAGTDLKQSKRQTGAVSNQQKAAQQRAATAYFICLHGPEEESPQASHLFSNRIAKGFPRWFKSYCSATRRIESRQVRDLPFQSEPMNGAHHAQPKRGPSGIMLVKRKQFSDRPALVEIVR